MSRGFKKIWVCGYVCGCGLGFSGDYGGFSVVVAYGCFCVLCGCMGGFIRGCMCVCMFVCMCGCMYGCMFGFKFGCLNIL